MTSVHRCRDAYRLVPDWHKVEAFLSRERGIPDDCYQCPPCRGEGERWLVTAGHNVSVVTAGCEQAAKEAMHVGIYGLRRRLVVPEEVQRITARPASPEDVARFEQMRQELQGAPRA